jgi:hypothetical protein
MFYWCGDRGRSAVKSLHANQFSQRKEIRDDAHSRFFAEDIPPIA